MEQQPARSFPDAFHKLFFHAGALTLTFARYEDHANSTLNPTWTLHTRFYFSADLPLQLLLLSFVSSHVSVRSGCHGRSQHLGWSLLCLSLSAF